MKKKLTENIVRYTRHHPPVTTKTDWARVDAMSDEMLVQNAKSDPDTLLIDEEFLKNAQWVIPESVQKERITTRVDADILEWLKQSGPHYQSRLNAILRSCMNAMKKTPHPKSR